MAVKLLIDAANQGMPQLYFGSKDYFPAMDTDKYQDYSGLDTGLLNYFDLDEGHRTCTDPEVVFGTAHSIKNSVESWDTDLTFWSCAFYTNLTHDFRESTLPSKNATFLLENQVDTSLSSATNVTSVLSMCLEAWCQNSLSCRSSLCVSAQLKQNDNSTLSAMALEGCLNDICDLDANRSANPDITGVGVLIGLLIQFILAMIACLYSLALVPRWILHYGKQSMEKHRQARSGIKERIVILLDDFQRAQSCFAIAIDIASIVTLETSATNMTDTDRRAIALVGFAGTLPTTMVYGTLLLVYNRVSPYTLSLTFLTWALTLIVRYLPGQIQPRQTKAGYVDTQPEACGMNSPKYICSFPVSDEGVLNLELLISVVNLIPMLTMIWLTVDSYYPIRNLSSRMASAGGKMAIIGRALKFTVEMASQVLFLISFLCYGLCMAYLYLEFRDGVRGGFASTTWTFGQVVAVTIWLPTMLSFINDCIYGSVKGRSQQLPPSLQVVRTSELAGLPIEEPRPSSSSATTEAAAAAAAAATVGEEENGEAKTTRQNEKDIGDEPVVRVSAIGQDVEEGEEAVCSGANGPGEGRDAPERPDS